jgi:ferric-dicitrate binding protein FerR (iron transport regulator)
MNHDAFAARLQACLDARIDPFDDAELVAWLDAHPAQLEAVARLWAAVAVLHGDAVVAAKGEAAPARRWPWLVLGAMGAGLAAALALAAVWPAHVAATRVLDASGRGAAAEPTVARGRVLSAVLQPITPSLGLAAPVRATEVLVANPRVRVEVFTEWSVR